MMVNERITEDIVREHFKRDAQFSEFKFEEQKSSRPKIDKLLKTASKKGSGRGYPEFIISNIPNAENLIIVIECKFDIAKHESDNKKKYADYAVDGCLLYSDYLSKDYDVLAIAVSGTKENLKISHFLQKQGKDSEEEIFGGKLLPIEDYVGGYRQDEAKRQEKHSEILAYSKTLNEDLYKLKIKEDKRSLLLSGILIALEDEAFRKSYQNYKFKKLAELLLGAITTQFENAKLQKDKLEKLQHNYAFIMTHDALTKEQKNSDFKTLKEIIDDIDNNINSFAKTYKYYDVLGQFYIEFLRYSNSDKGLGIVLTPPHITDFFSDIVEIKEDDIVYDNCTGTGGFLVTAMKHMIEKAKGDQNREKSIKENQLYGVEFQPEIYPLAVSNMFLHGDGKSNIIDGDCFDLKTVNSMKEKKPTVGFLNPPYKSKKDDIEEFEFILNNLDVLQKHGRCVAIVPMSCVLAQKGERLQLKERLLEKHTLKAVFSMPDELFFNSKVGVVTAVLFIEAHVPHSDKKPTFFGYFKDDGFTKRKNLGRTDESEKWRNIKQNWLDLYLSGQNKTGVSIVKKVTAQDEWCAEAYMNTDYSSLTQSDFIQNIHSFIVFLFKEKQIKAATDASAVSKKVCLKDIKWKYFKVTEMFDVKGTKTTAKIKAQSSGGGSFPYITTQATNNATEGFYNIKTEKGNVIVIDSATIGHSTYQPVDFSASDHVEKLIPKFYMNSYNAIFIVTMLNKERYRYGYGRKFSQTRIKNTKLKLPVNSKGKPDWQFMEDYIKSLPYSKNL